MRRLATAVTVVLLLAVPVTASAHLMPTSAVRLDIEAHSVGGEIRLPLGRLAVALKRTTLTSAQAMADHVALERYVSRHVSVSGWRTAIGTAHVEGTELVLPLTLTPPDGTVTGFDLHYDVIINQLVTHRAIATIQTQWKTGTTARDPRTLGVFAWNQTTIHVPAGGGSWLQGFGATVGLGVEHISTGADHLLFLLMLLIPAPLVARGGRWRRGDSGKRSAVRVVHVVSAFAIGHSTTLALATLGVIHAPSQVVESLIAVSIMVSAVHALRPLVPRGEPLIAAGFGLVHGLAFASLLGGLGLSGGALVASLFGFNLGIELTQLFVVALMMPALFVLSRTAVYPVLRVSVALFGLVMSAGWLLDRTGLIGSDPFAGVERFAIDNPFAIAGALALAAAASSLLPEARQEVLSSA